MLLSRPVILEYLKKGNIIIDPFREDLLGTDSYDLTLGEWYFACQKSRDDIGTFNPYSETDIKRVWGKPKLAKPLSEWLQKNQIKNLKGVRADKKIILINPGENILCHTREFAGGVENITTRIAAKSRVGRAFIDICKGANFGDVGFVNRWTLELTNVFHEKIILVVGTRIAQISFYEVAPVGDKDYSTYGTFQEKAAKGLIEIKENWTPLTMLPKPLQIV